MSISPADTEILIQSAVEGNEQAFGILIELWRKQMLRLAERYTHCHAEAEDAVQSAFIKAWKSLSGFRGESRFSTWITRIVINEIHMLQRRPGYRRLEYRDDLNLVESTLPEYERSFRMESPEEHLLRLERSHRLRAAVSALPHSLRAVLEFEIGEELPLEETAKRLNLSVSAVKSRRVRGRAELRRRVLNAEKNHIRSVSG